MKTKLLAMLAVSGLLTASCMYVAPAMADDSSPNAGQSMPAPSDNGASQNSNMNSSGSSSDTNSSSGTSNSDDNNGGGSPDTATGDDDY